MLALWGSSGIVSVNMSETNGDGSLTLLLMDSAPESCLGCETLFANCSKLARNVIDNSMSLEQAKEELEADLSANCRGKISRFAGWGKLSFECTYELPIDPLNTLAPR